MTTGTPSSIFSTNVHAFHILISLISGANMVLAVSAKCAWCQNQPNFTTPLYPPSCIIPVASITDFFQAVGQICSTSSMAHNLIQCRTVLQKAIAAGAKVRQHCQHSNSITLNTLQVGALPTRSQRLHRRITRRNSKTLSPSIKIPIPPRAPGRC